MSYRPKEDGSYVTSDSEGRGRRAGGLNPEQGAASAPETASKSANSAATADVVEPCC